MASGIAPTTYRLLLALYPRDFRDRYADDLVQALADLSGDLGARRAWQRVALDVAVTAPRYRMETLMNERHQPAVLTAGIVVLAALGILSVPLGLAPGLALLPIAVVLGLSQRSKLAQSLDTHGGTDLRRRRLTIATILTALLPVVYLVSLPILGDDWGADATVAFGLWFAVLITAVYFFIAGFNTPRRPAIAH